MEALGAGANIAAFVVVAAQLSKFLYTTFCDIKDGPDAIRKVASHMQQLHGVLEQLKLSPLVAHDDALVGHIALCVKDLNQLADGVSRLQFLPDEKRSGKLWKRVKCFLDEKKLASIHDQLIRHTTTLSLRHSVLQSNTICQILSNTNLATQSIEALNERIARQVQGNTSEFNALGQNVRGLLASQTNTLQNNLTSIQASIENVSSVSHGNTEMMLNVLDEIKHLVTSQIHRGSNQQEQETSRTPSDNGSPSTEIAKNLSGESDPNNDLIRTITRLCNLIKLKNRTFDVYEENDSEAEDIVDDLQTLLNLARRYGHTAQQTRDVSPTVLRSNIRRFNQAFGQFQLAINTEGERQNENSLAIKQKQTYTKIQIKDLGSLSFRVTRQTRASPKIAKDIRHRKTTYSDLAMTVTFMPSDPKKFSMIVASTLQRGGWGSVAPAISRLDINRVLPADSPVFQIVQEDRLQELRVMLQNGEASLRDHDEFGANLLMYSLEAPEVCKFLLSTKTLDLDHIASDRGVNKRFQIGSYTSVALDILPESTEMPSIVLNECQKLLLEAGADPGVQINNRSFLSRVAIFGRDQSIKLVWGPYIRGHIYNPGSASTELLFKACSAARYRADYEERFSAILELGADILARNGQGRSCLHICVINISPLGRNQLLALDTIKMLLRRGADPYALDNEGISVSEMAYDSKYTLRGKEKIGSVAGDVWDRALHMCGYDIVQFRQNYPRKAQYNQYYTAEDFRRLWWDDEDECPYPDWPSDEVQRSEHMRTTASPDVIMNRKILPLRRAKRPSPKTNSA